MSNSGLNATVRILRQSFWKPSSPWLACQQRSPRPLTPNCNPTQDEVASTTTSKWEISSRPLALDLFRRPVEWLTARCRYVDEAMSRDGLINNRSRCGGPPTTLPVLNCAHSWNETKTNWNENSFETVFFSAETKRFCCHGDIPSYLPRLVMLLLCSHLIGFCPFWTNIEWLSYVHSSVFVI